MLVCTHLLFTTIVTATILFTNELSASGIVVLCSDQKSINVSHEKINIKIEIAIFKKIESKSIET